MRLSYNKKPCISTFGAKIDPATSWPSVIIPAVSIYIRAPKGHVELKKEILSDEVERVTSIRSNSVKLNGLNHLESPHQIQMGFFTKAPRPGFRVFDESGIMIFLKK